MNEVIWPPSWRSLTTKRKDLLFRAVERERIAALIVAKELPRRPRRLLIFNERIREAEGLFADLKSAFPDVRFGLEHSELPTRQRNQVLKRFRTGDVQILVSVKALIEGLDVPEIDAAVSVASTSSVRQRIQSLGRALRRRFDEEDADARRIHILYVADTADEEIYARENWDDITGRDGNIYLFWALGAEGPEGRPGPPGCLCLQSARSGNDWVNVCRTSRSSGAPGQTPSFLWTLSVTSLPRTTTSCRIRKGYPRWSAR